MPNLIEMRKCTLCADGTDAGGRQSDSGTQASTHLLDDSKAALAKCCPQCVVIQDLAVSAQTSTRHKMKHTC